MRHLSLSDNLEFLKAQHPNELLKGRLALEPGFSMPQTHLDWGLISDIAVACWLSPQGFDDRVNHLHRMLWGRWIFNQHPTYCLTEGLLYEFLRRGSPSCSKDWEHPTKPFLLCFPVNSVRAPATEVPLDCLLVVFSSGDDGYGVTSGRLIISGLDGEGMLWYAGFDIDAVGALVPHFSPQEDSWIHYAVCNWLITLGEIALEAAIAFF
jgi:hypothetical protein